MANYTHLTGRSVPSGDVINFEFDVASLAQFIGVAVAFNKTMETKEYKNNLFEVAFAEADNKFNINAAAYAKASDDIRHMYEWGTLGINTKRSSVRPNPMSPRARLWQTQAIGSGWDRELTYFFRPSMGTVPKPTASETGMDPAIIAKMKPYVFKWKSEMMEWGRRTDVSPKRRFLLIPLTKENKAQGWNLRPNDIKRGYLLLEKSVSFYSGGYTHAEKFTSFWTSFWGKEAEVIIDESMQRQFLMDFDPEWQKRTRGMPMPVKEQDIPAMIEKKAAVIAKQVLAQSESRAKQKAADRAEWANIMREERKSK